MDDEASEHEVDGEVYVGYPGGVDSRHADRVVRTSALPQDDLDCIVCSSTDRGVRHHSAVAGGQELSVGEYDAEEGLGEQRGAVEAFGAEETQAECVRGGGEGDVDVVEVDVVERKPMGWRTSAGWPSARMAARVSSTVGPIQGPPATPWLWKAKNHFFKLGS